MTITLVLDSMEGWDNVWLVECSRSGSLRASGRHRLATRTLNSNRNPFIPPLH